MTGRFFSGAPILLSKNFDWMIAFYGRFGVVEIMRFGTRQLLIRHERLELSFTPRPNNRPGNQWHSFYARALNTAALKWEWTTVDLPHEGIPREVPATPRPWGVIEAHIIEPGGTLVTLGALGEDIPPSHDAASDEEGLAHDGR